MMEKFLIILLSFSSLVFAGYACYDLDAYQDENGQITNWEEVTKRVEQQVKQDYYPDCISDGGAGSTFEARNYGRKKRRMSWHERLKAWIYKVFCYM